MTVRAAAPGRVYIPHDDRHDGIHRAPMEQQSSTRPWEEIAMGMGRMMSSMTDKREGDVTRAIESATAAVPSAEHRRQANPIPKRVHHDHRLCLALADQIIQNHICRTR